MARDREVMTAAQLYMDIGYTARLPADESPFQTSGAGVRKFLFSLSYRRSLEQGGETPCH